MEENQNQNTYEEQLKAFVRPLFIKLYKKEIAIWCAFFFVCGFATYSLLSFINSYIEDTDTYSATLTSVGKYREENPSTTSSSSPPEEFEEF